MKTVNEKLTKWAIDKIKSQYPEDIALVIGHDTLKLDKDKEASTISYFVPVDKIPYGFAKTFIIDGVGYDLFPRTWAQLKDLADLSGYNISCLGDVEILYYRTDDEKVRFLNLQEKLHKNLADKNYMYCKAQEKLQYAIELYQDMLFKNSLYKIRTDAGYIVDFLSIATAYSNQTYFKHGQINQIDALKKMKFIPEKFIELYEKIVYENTKEGLNKACNEMISTTKDFIKEKCDKWSDEKNQNFEELAEWYHELSYTFRRIYHYCSENDKVNSFMWGCMMQSELNIVSEDFGLHDFDLIGYFNADDMTKYLKRAKEIEKQIISIIENNGIELDSYDSVEEFLQKN